MTNRKHGRQKHESARKSFRRETHQTRKIEEDERRRGRGISGEEDAKRARDGEEGREEAEVDVEE